MSLYWSQHGALDSTSLSELFQRMFLVICYEILSSSLVYMIALKTGACHQTSGKLRELQRKPDATIGSRSSITLSFTLTRQDAKGRCGEDRSCRSSAQPPGPVVTQEVTTKLRNWWRSSHLIPLNKDSEARVTVGSVTSGLVAVCDKNQDFPNISNFSKYAIHPNLKWKL